MTPFLRRLTIVAAAALAACGQPDAPDSAAPSVSAPTEGSVSIERTPCFGFCPVYKATVTADDNLVFEGERYVAAEGAHEKRLPEGSFDKLIAIAKAHDFSSFSSEVTNCFDVTDMPSVVIEINAGTLQHDLIFYEGCLSFDGRENLEAMIAEIDAALALDEWIGPREDFMGAGD